jgi:hypothetical protein
VQIARTLSHLVKQATRLQGWVTGFHDGIYTVRKNSIAKNTKAASRRQKTSMTRLSRSPQITGFIGAAAYELVLSGLGQTLR